MTAAAVNRLLGREPEQRRLEALFARAQEDSNGQALLVSGEPGIGKSVLLAWATRAASARGMRVLTAPGTPSEASLPFAGLHRLLRPILADVDALPRPQRDAVRAAFGLTGAAAPELFLIALGVLTLLAEATNEAPVLVVVDDGHWLDRETAEVLAFVARRIEEEPIALIVSVRTRQAHGLAEAGMAELRLEPLAPAPASALLGSRFPGLSSAIHEQVLDQAAGNPLALVELPLGSVEAPRAGSDDAWLPLTARLEQAFASRLPELPEVARTLLLVAAADDGDTIGEVVEAGMALRGADVGADDLEGAIAVGLIELDEATIRFRHPLVRSAIYQSASPVERRAAHAALADVILDEDRSVWHRAGASVGPDDDVARQLEVAAARAQRRGAIATARVGLERAARLTLDSGDRMRRLLGAAHLAADLGDGETTLRLLGEAAKEDLTAQERVRIASGRVPFDASLALGPADLRPQVEAGEHAAAGGDVDAAMHVLIDAAALTWMLDLPWAGVRAPLVDAIERLAPEPDDPRVLVALAVGAPVERGRVVLNALRRRSTAPARDASTSYLEGWAASNVGAFDLAIAPLSRAVVELRAEGRLGVLSRALILLTWSAYHTGDFRMAITAADEAVRLTRETAQPHGVSYAMGAMAIVHAARGDLKAARELVEALERDPLVLGARAMLATLQHAHGLIALGEGRITNAYAHLRRIFEPGGPANHRAIEQSALMDLVEVAVHLAEHREARIVVERMERVAEQTAAPLLLASLAFARPLLAADEDAEALFVAALSNDLRRWPFLHARMSLAYGRWLRRGRRVSEARVPLESAATAFVLLDASRWHERAVRELRAAGGDVERRPPADYDALTPQEMQIAQLAANGLTNREIAQDLFISPRTVSTHLHRIFTKLGITARAQLGDALGSTGSGPLD